MTSPFTVAMTDTLQKLFGSAVRVKLLRLFLFNPNRPFGIAEAMARTRSPRASVRREIALLGRVGVLARVPRRRIAQFILNEDFPYLAALQSLLLLNTSARGEELYERVRTAGTIKLIVAGGFFVGEQGALLDLLIVGDRIKDHTLKSQVRLLESEIGRELRYAFLSTEEFFYRLNMNDRLVRDMLDYPHQIAFDRLNIGLI